MEFKVILGADLIIKKFRPIVTFEQHIEIEDYMKIVQHFKNNDYNVYIIDEILPGCRHDCRNLIAIPKEILDPIFIDNIHKYLNNNCLKQC